MAQIDDRQKTTKMKKKNFFDPKQFIEIAREMIVGGQH